MRTIGIIQLFSKYHVKVVVEAIQLFLKYFTFFDEIILSSNRFKDSLNAIYFESLASINNQPNIFSNDHFNLQRGKKLGM